MKSEKAYVLDSYALLAHFQGEPEGAQVKALLRRSQERELQLYLSLINLGEVAYLAERVWGEEGLRQTLFAIDQLPITIAEVTRERVLAAAHVKSQHAISYADTFTVALAQELDAPVVTGDPDFEKVQDLVDIFWLER